MARRTLRTTTILIIIQSLLFFPAPVSRAQDSPTEAEAKRAQEAANQFLKLLEETGDFSYVIDEMFARDFIERYVQKHMREGEEPNSSSVITFASGISYKRDLLYQATVEDWWRLYIATNNLIYHVFVIGLNKFAEDILNDRELDDEKFNNLIPPKVITLFNNHPVLKGFFDKDDDPKPTEPAEERQGDDVEKKEEPKGDDVEKKEEPKGDDVEKKEEPKGDTAEKKSGPKYIETPEEMRSVVETLQEGLRLLLDEQDAHSPKLTDDAKKAIEKFIKEEPVEPWIHVSDKDCFGFPAGVRHMDVLTPILFKLTLGEINGELRIAWVELFFPSC